MKRFSILIITFLFLNIVYASSNPSNVKTSAKKAAEDLSGIPEWISNPDSEYNSRLYLTGVGSASEENAAEDDAKGELITSLITQISANEKSNIFADSTSEYASITSTINTSSELKSIKGLRIVNKYQAKDGTFYALAVIKKQDAVDFYSKQIQKNDAKIQEYMEYADINHTISGIIYCQKAYTLAKDNDYYLYLIDIIDSPFPSEIELSYGSTVKLSKQISEIKKQVPVKVVVENDFKNLIKTTFTDSLNKLGFVTTDKNNASIIINAIVDVEKYESPDEKHVFYNYLLTSEMTVVTTQEVVNNFTVHGRAGHVNDQGAKDKAYLMLSKDIEKNFKADLLKLAEEN